MDSADFRKTCLSSGYACAYIADKYIAAHGDRNYTLDDLIEASRLDEQRQTMLDKADLLGGYRSSKSYKEDI